MKFVDVPELAKAHAFVAEGLKILEDNYRDYQMSYRVLGQWNTDTAACKRAWQAVLETLVRQILSLPEMKVEEDWIHASVKGHLMNRCGWPKSPKGLEEYSENEVRTILT